MRKKIGKNGIASISAIIIAVVLFTVTILSLSGVTTAVSTTCDSCTDCNSKINSGAYDTVYLALDIKDLAGNCIVFKANNTVFDCNGYTIDGDDTGTDRGIIIDRALNNTIRNCTIADFYYGIHLFNSKNNTLLNNNVSSNTRNGILLEFSNNNTIKNNIVDFNYDGVYLSQALSNNIRKNEMCANTRYDIYLAGATDNYGDENTCDNPDGWNDESATGCKFSCAVAANCTDVYDNMIITADTTLCPRIYNIADAGATGVIKIGANNIELDCNSAELKGTSTGVGIYNSGFDDVTIKNCSIYNYSTGIYLIADHNTLLQNLVQDNTQYGIRVASAFNVLVKNTAMRNSDGIFLDYSFSNIYDSNLADFNNLAGFRLYHTENETFVNNVAYANYYGFAVEHGSNNNILRSNDVRENNRGVYIFNSLRNRLSNNTLNDNDYGAYIHSSSSNTLVNNTANSNNNYGIFVFLSSINNTIANNTVEENPTDIYLSSDSTNNRGCNYASKIVDMNANAIFSIPHDDFKIIADTKLCPGVYNILDHGSSGVFKINGTYITLDCNNATIYGDNTGDGIYNYLRSHITAKNCYLRDYNKAIYFSYSTNNTFLRNRLDSNSNSGIFLDYVSYSKMIQNNGSYNTYGILLQNSDANNLTNNTFYYGTRGISLTDSNENGLRNNTMFLNNIGIRLYSSIRNSVDGNRLYNNSASGIHVQNDVVEGERNKITNNILNNNNVGIRLWSANYYNYIANNSLTSNNYGIELLSSTVNNITGNRVTGSNWSGIHLSASNHNDISYNNVSSNRDGIYLYDSGYNQIFRNNVVLNGDRGIILHESSLNNLGYNDVTQNSYGIYLTMSSENTLNRNKACSNIFSDIHVDGGSSNSGDYNTCDETEGWNDDGTTGCTYGCLFYNVKNMARYPSRGAFLISDENWRDVLSIVPLTTWGRIGVQKYPTLIYHREGDRFDADAVIYFLQKYKPTNLTILLRNGTNTPVVLDATLRSPLPVGANLTAAQISKISLNDYFSFWSRRDIFVISQDRYDVGLMASVFASYHNAPLLFDGRFDYNVIRFKKVYLVGDFTESRLNAIRSVANIIGAYSLSELERHYVNLTRTNKIILVNPDDRGIALDLEFAPDKTAHIFSIYANHSLAAPFLAAGKHEVIISAATRDYIRIDDFVDDKIRSFNISGLVYLTIVASPEAIPMARADLPFPPGVYGNRIVYEDYRDGNLDVYVYNMSDSSTKRLTSNFYNQFGVSIYGNVVVWVSNEDGMFHTYDLSTGVEIPQDRAELWGAHTALHGNRIVYAKNVGGNIDIYLYDISTGITTRITTNETMQLKPVIYGDRIVWEDYRYGNSDIYMYNLLTSVETRVTTSPQFESDPAIYGGRVVWTDNRNGNNDIYMYDISTGAESRITSSSAHQESPSIYGDIIVYQDDRNGNWDIYMYNITSGTETRLTAESAQQKAPTIYENKIAYYGQVGTGYWAIFLRNITTSSQWIRDTLAGRSMCGAWWTELDGRFYGSTTNLGHQDRAVGRIAGITVSDVSAYIARDLFFDDLPKNRDALLNVREDHQDETSGGETDTAMLTNYARNYFWTADVRAQFLGETFYAGYAGVDNITNHTDTVNKYNRSYLILFDDHGNDWGFAGMMDTGYLDRNDVYLDPSVVLDLACSTCAYEHTKRELFCLQGLRRGAMVQMGAVDVSYWHRMFDDILYGSFVQNKTIGQAYMEARNEDYDVNHHNFCDKRLMRGDPFYALLGDPTLKPKWWP